MLQSAAITTVADVRRFPGSRRYPQYNQQSLSESLARVDIRYEWMPELGGRRKPLPDSPNTAWRNASFRAYADYMQTDAFAVGIDRVTQLTRAGGTAVMCSEAVWWRCHRSLIADHFKVRGYAVTHLLAPGHLQQHPYSSAARIVNGQLSYAA